MDFTRSEQYLTAGIKVKELNSSILYLEFIFLNRQDQHGIYPPWDDVSRDMLLKLTDWSSETYRWVKAILL